LEDDVLDDGKSAGFSNKFKNLLGNGQSKNKTKTVLAVVLFAVVIIIFASTYFPSSSSNNKTQNTIISVSDYASNTELRLKRLLSSVKGVGNVDVFIYIKSSEEIVYKEDTETITSSANTTVKNTTVFDQSGNEKNAVVVVTKFPQIEGVLIVAGGTGNSIIKLKIIDAVSCVLGLSPSRIEVLEGKN